MLEKPEECTNRELYLMLESLDVKIDNVLAQTTKTNGRVNGLEAGFSEMKIWKANIEGKTWLVSLIVASVVAGVIGLFFK